MPAWCSPCEGTANGRLNLKTVYWGGVPQCGRSVSAGTGVYLCFVKYEARWGQGEDLDRYARFVRFVAQVSERVVPQVPRCWWIPKLVCQYFMPTIC